jgi:putative inorganic carbon (hco3(-)) transporter
MLTTTDNKQNLYNFMLVTGTTFTVLVAMFSAYAVWAFELKWAVFTFLGILFPFVLAIMGDARRFILGLMIFSIPLNADYHFMLHPSPGGANGLTFGLTEILLISLIIHTIINSVKKGDEFRIKFFPVISIPTLAIIVMSLISLVKATDYQWAFFDIFTFLKVFVMFLFLANNIKNKDDVSMVVRTLFLGLFFQSIIISLQYYDIALNLHRIGLGEPIEILEFKMESSNVARPGGTIGHCNHLARYLGLLLPMAIILSVTEKSRINRWFASLVAVTGIAALVFTLTRSAWMGVVLSVIVMVPFMFAQRILNLKMLAKIVFAVVIASVILFALGDIITDRIVSDDSGSAMTRWTTAKVAFKIIQDHPFLGVGINNYGTVLKDYWLSEDLFTRKAAVHNTYLLIASEIGLLGFGVYLWFLIAFYIRTRKAIKSFSKYFSSIAIGVMGGLAAFALTAFSDKSYKESYPVLLLFWGMAAVIEAMNFIETQQEPAQLPARNERSRNYDIKRNCSIYR